MRPTADTARAFSWLLAYGAPDDVLARRSDRFAAVTPDSARAAGARYLDPDRVRTVIVGDWAALQAPVSALGWGPVELRTPEGALVGAKPQRSPPPSVFSKTPSAASVCRCGWTLSAPPKT